MAGSVASGMDRWERLQGRRSPAAQKERGERLLPGGTPRHVRIYDNGGESVDRYTVVFTGRIPGKLAGWTFYRAMGDAPRVGSGTGVCQFGEVFGPIDRPRYGHLGRKISFEDLPEGCRKVVLDDYRELWDLGNLGGEASGRYPHKEATGTATGAKGRAA